MSAEQTAIDEDSLIGQILANRYQIEVKLGEGAMGAVYRAKHVKVGRPFAVKILHSKLLEDKKVEKRFEREAELAGRLRHPNVIGVVDVGETPGGQRYMVMDFAKGKDLATMLEEAPMKPERVLHLTRQMLEGLYHAHEAGLIHRDFKPENVIIEQDDHGTEIPRIVDFGIAILRDGGDSTSGAGRLTTNGLVLGTPHYMAPEQAVADPIDHRIDLFALGIVIYELLSGKLPFDGTGAEVARANLLLDPPPISQRVPYLEVDPLLEAFARKLMAKKRDMRPANAKVARELLDLIDRDREAAAAALGVPVASVRAPQITQDVAPQKHANEDSGNYLVPPAPAQPLVAMDTTELEAPPLRRPSEASFATSPSEPLDMAAPRSRRGWIVAGLAASVAAAAIIVVVSTRAARDDDKPKAQPEEKVVMQAPEPAPPPPAETPVAPAPRPVEDVAKPVDPQPVESVAKAIEKKRVKKPAVKPEVKKPEINSDIKQPEVAKTVEKPSQKPPEVINATTDPKVAFANQYGAVGKQLRALGDQANDLWPQFRMINFNAAMRSPEKLSESTAILNQIAKAAASRQ